MRTQYATRHSLSARRGGHWLPMMPKAWENGGDESRGFSHSLFMLGRLLLSAYPNRVMRGPRLPVLFYHTSTPRPHVLPNVKNACSCLRQHSVLFTAHANKRMKITYSAGIRGWCRCLQAASVLSHLPPCTASRAALLFSPACKRAVWRATRQFNEVSPRLSRCRSAHAPRAATACRRPWLPRRQ